MYGIGVGMRFLTVQLSRFQRDSPDNEAHVPSPASPMVGTIDVRTLS